MTAFFLAILLSCFPLDSVRDSVPSSILLAGRMDVARGAATLHCAHHRIQGSLDARVSAEVGDVILSWTFAACGCAQFPASAPLGFIFIDRLLFISVAGLPVCCLGRRSIGLASRGTECIGVATSAACPDWG